MTTEQLLIPRWELTLEFPSSNFRFGDIIWPNADRGWSPDEYPALFKPLPWHAKRRIDELIHVEYVKVIDYVGYWRVGDIVKVEGVNIDCSSRNPVFLGYYLSKQLSHFHPLDSVEPATEEDYIQFKKSES